MNRWLLPFCFLLLGGCDRGAFSTGAKDATGETAVKYVICGARETNCFVAARFKDLDACISHKAWAEMLCDSKSKPGEMYCRRDAGPAIGVSYCIY